METARSIGRLERDIKDEVTTKQNETDNMSALSECNHASHVFRPYISRAFCGDGGNERAASQSPSALSHAYPFKVSANYE
jgi:hypothetical protein